MVQWIRLYNGLESDFVSKAAGWTEVAALLDAGYADLNSAGSAFSFTLSSGFVCVSNCSDVKGG